ncbi:MAG: hypothetical protein K2X36_00650, partial [Microbacteriaceae bacterium]|nr:hypothetical protein [Microbacteriaceae bacterium]
MGGAMNVLNFPSQSTRPLPVNVELEQAVLGSLLMDNSVFQAVSSILKTEHFHEPIHARIYEVASELIIAGKVASPLTLKTFLGDHDLGGVTMPQYLARLAAASSGTGSVRDYAEFVRDLAARRAMISVASDLIEKAHDRALARHHERHRGYEWRRPRAHGKRHSADISVSRRPD